MNSSHLLETLDLTRRFGGVTALDRFNLTLDKGELVGLIGPNGAGKTTLFNLVTGMLKPTSGDVRFNGRSIVGKPPDQVLKLGIARTFQNMRLFGKMTVLENVMVAASSRARSSLANSLFGGKASGREERAFLAEALTWLDAMGIADLKDVRAESLPYGDQRRLEIARALAARPEVLLLDEPTCGMNPTETAEAAEHIKRLHGLGVTLLLIEHDMKVVMGICERIVVLDHGSKIAEGTPQEVRSDPAVVEAYLGRRAGA